MSTSELDSRCTGISMKKSVENLVISSQDAIGQSISQALSFSGVLSQHGNQTVQEHKSVSRSPSPSLRGTENGSDLTDNDYKLTDSFALMTTLGNASESSGASDVTPPRNDSQNSTKVPTDPIRYHAAGYSAKKKKSWYNSLYPTYKSKCDDFKRLFKDLPDDERLIVDYACALQKDILVQGRLYASQSYLCFYANIFSWETTLALKWKQVKNISKEKTALVIPNAILVSTESEKHFFTTFATRDKSFLMLFRVWQNALMDQPTTSHEIRQWVHDSYGSELGFDSGDECYLREISYDTCCNVVDAQSEQEVLDPSSAEASGAGDEVAGADRRQRDSSPARGVGDVAFNSEPGDTLPTDMSDTSDSEHEKIPNGSECEKCVSAHDGKLLLQKQFPINIDLLFTMMFTNSKFNVELLAARGTTDYVQSSWRPSGGVKCRQISYRLGLTSGPIGPKEVHVTETQVMNKCSKPGLLYSIDATSENAGIPYADYFSVEVHYCLRKAPDGCTDVALLAKLNYKKTMWPMIKAFLEKNTLSGLEQYCRVLATRLDDVSVPPRARPPRRRQALASGAVGGGSQAAGVAAGARVGLGPGLGAGGPRGSSWRGLPLPLLLLALLLLNALLYYRLHTRSAAPVYHREEGAEWAGALERLAREQRSTMRSWMRALHDAIQHLHQTELSIVKLLETLKLPLDKSQDASEPPPLRSEL